MRADGMQAEDTRTPLADGTLVKIPSAPMPPRRSQPRLRGGPRSGVDAAEALKRPPRTHGGPVSRPGGGFSTSCSHTPASTGVSTQRCRNSPSLSPVATVTTNPSHNLVRSHRNKNTRTRTLESQTNS